MLGRRGTCCPPSPRRRLHTKGFRPPQRAIQCPNARTEPRLPPRRISQGVLLRGKMRVRAGDPNRAGGCARANQAHACRWWRWLRAFASAGRAA